jgi:hypothetical protein
MNIIVSCFEIRSMILVYFISNRQTTLGHFMRVAEQWTPYASGRTGTLYASGRTVDTLCEWPNRDTLLEWPNSGHLMRVAEPRSGEGFMLLFWRYNWVVSMSRDYELRGCHVRFLRTVIVVYCYLHNRCPSSPPDLSSSRQCWCFGILSVEF